MAAAEGTELTPEDAFRLVEDGAQLVDVRQPHEHEAGHIGGDRHVPLADLPSQADTLDRDRPVVFYCRVGSRSAMAVEAFRTGGFEAYNLAGGIEAWTEAGRPIEPEGGRVVSSNLPG